MINPDPYLDHDAPHAALEADARQWRRDRRERIATAVFQALLSKPEVVASPHEIAACAASYADVLIVLLDKETQP